MTELHRVVRAAPQSPGWIVTDREGVVILTVRTKREALEVATAELRAHPAGGRLRVHYADGRLENERVVAGAVRGRVAAGAVARPPTPQDTVGAIRREGKHVDKGLDAMDWVLTVAASLGAPTGALLNPSIQEAAGNGWIALTLATFTWTFGCALAIVVVRRSGLTSYPLVGAVGLCYGLALLIAAGIGHGVLDINTVEGAGPFSFLAGVVLAALEAYGPVGFLLGLGLGTWLGLRLSEHVEDGFAV